MTTNETFYEGGGGYRTAFDLSLDEERRIVEIHFLVYDGWVFEWILVTNPESLPSSESYFPGYRATGAGNPPDWDCHLRDWPRLGQKIEPRRDLTFGK